VQRKLSFGPSLIIKFNYKRRYLRDFLKKLSKNAGENHQWDLGILIVVVEIEEHDR
jgi:hypothetical protein